MNLREALLRLTQLLRRNNDRPHIPQEGKLTSWEKGYTEDLKLTVCLGIPLHVQEVSKLEEIIFDFQARGERWGIA